MMVDGDDVRRAAAESRGLLRAAMDQSWDAPVPDLDLTITEVVAHIAQCCIWYTVDLTAAGRELEVITPTVDSRGNAAQLVEAVDVCATLLAQTVDAAPSTVRGFHPFGTADRSGFAAMGCDEILIHTADVAAAWDCEWRPDDPLAAAVVARLFPWAPAGGPPWETLLWCNGRAPLGDHRRLTRWRWHCAPLEDWDGEVPAFAR